VEQEETRPVGKKDRDIAYVFPIYCKVAHRILQYKHTTNLLVVIIAFFENMNYNISYASERLYSENRIPKLAYLGRPAGLMQARLACWPVGRKD